MSKAEIRRNIVVVNQIVRKRFYRNLMLYVIVFFYMYS